MITLTSDNFRLSKISLIFNILIIFILYTKIVYQMTEIGETYLGKKIIEKHEFNVKGTFNSYYAANS